MQVFKQYLYKGKDDMAIITISNIYSTVQGSDLTPEVQKDLKETLSYEVQNARFKIEQMEKKRNLFNYKNKYNKKPSWDGIRKLYWEKNPSFGSFYTGMISAVGDVLKQHNVPFKIQDQRTRPPSNCPQLTFSPPNDFEKRQYQEWTVDLSYKATRGIIEAATGSGKTLMVTDLISRIKTTPFLFVVLSTDLLEQSHDTLSSCLNVPVGKIGGGFCDIQDINVMTVQTAIKAINYNNKEFKIKEYLYDDDDKESWNDSTTDSSLKAESIKKLIENCKGIVADECHHFSSRTCKELLRVAKNAFWKYGGSATPYREDGEEMMLQALFGRKIVQVNASYLIKREYLVKPYIFNLKMNGDYEDYKSYQGIYSHNIVKNQRLHEQTIKIANHFEQNGITTLILVKEYEHGENLLALKPGIPFIKGNQSRMCRKNAIDDLRDGKTKVAIATTLADEGLDIRRLGAVIIAGGGKSITRIYQRVGRTLRPYKNKDRAFVVTFHHNYKFLHSHGLRISRLLKKEEEFNLKNSTEETIINDINKRLK
jgi:superfamily II DNA or RNA helicase